MRWLCMVAIANVLTFGCGPSDDTGVRPDGGGGSEQSADAASCGVEQQTIEATNPAPDMLIVLDRSGSMNESIDGGWFSPSKWRVMRDALKTVTLANQQAIRFGLKMFPSNNGCDVGAGMPVGIDLGQSSAIVDAMNDSGAGGDTPAQLGLQRALAIYQAAPASTGARYVLFATDGFPNCADSEEEAETATIDAVEALADAGIKSFVVGFGSSVTANPGFLDQVAMAGLVPRPNGPPHFYPANNEAQLKQALQQIAGGVAVPSCSFTLDELPPVPDLVSVSIDDTAVPRDPDHVEGWDYHPDMSTITFFGSYCTMVESGGATNVEFLYGCPGPMVE
jgi:hypothetical protein